MSVWTALLCALFAVTPQPPVPVQLTYRVELTRSERGSRALVSSARAIATVTPTEDGPRVTWLLPTVSEVPGFPSAWREQFGRCAAPSAKGGDVGHTPGLRMEHEGLPYWVPVPIGWFADAGKIEPRGSWSHGDEEYRVGSLTQLGTRGIWPIEVVSPTGTLESLKVDSETGIIQSSVRKVFVGRGAEYQLETTLDSKMELDAAHADLENGVAQRWLALQSQVNPPTGKAEAGAGHRLATMTGAQLEVASKSAASLITSSAQTSWSDFSKIVRDGVAKDLERDAALRKLATSIIGQQAPPLHFLKLRALPAPAVEPNQVTVLHFWNYDGETLMEPYGQVGYLDFLNRQRKRLGVQVIGVAVDPALANGSDQGAAIRRIHKLQEFMHVEYPVAADDGSLLGEFGDPRSAGGVLPLWVVIDPQGVVTSYYAGDYTVTANQGLKELDAIVMEALKKRATQ